MRVLVACEFSGIVRDAFAALGHDAWSCDLLPTERPGNHIQDDVLKHLDDVWDLMIAHPPCTYLTNAGVRHLHDHVVTRAGNREKVFGAKRWVEMKKAAQFFNDLKHAPVPLICIENPIPHGYARELIGNYSQLIQPWMFGHGETKATCLWLKGIHPLERTHRKDDLFCSQEPVERVPKVHWTRPSMVRWMERSRTYPGIAKAMAEQWGKLDFNPQACYTRAGDASELGL